MPASTSLPVRTARKPTIDNNEYAIRVIQPQIESYDSPAQLAYAPLRIKVMASFSWNVPRGLNDNLSYNS